MAGSLDLISSRLGAISSEAGDTLSWSGIEGAGKMISLCIGQPSPLINVSGTTGTCFHKPIKPERLYGRL